MVKKVFDILPPNKRETIRDFTPKGYDPRENGSAVQVKKFLFILPIAFLLTGAVLYFKLSKVEIKIWPYTENSTFKAKITVDKNLLLPNFETKTIPGRIFTKEKTITKKFYSSGKKIKSAKARGTIRIYNKYYLPQTLVANTRFQAPLEKFHPSLKDNEKPWFRIQKRVTIPAKGYKDVAVVADSPGEKYNIEPSKFSIPGLAGTPQYTLVYGESFQPMEGGVKKEVSQVTEEDLNKAEKILTEKATEECFKSIRHSLADNFIFLDDSSKVDILTASSSVDVGEEVESFNFQTKVKVTVLAFREKDTKDFIKEFINSRISQGEKFYQDSLKIYYSPQRVDLQKGKMDLSLTAEAKIYSDIDITELKESLRGKSLDQVDLFLKHLISVSRVSINCWPFRIGKIPNDPNRIKIILMFD